MPRPRTPPVKHQNAEQDLLQAGANEGLRIDSRVSLLSDFSVAPIFEDTTVYVLDAKLDVPNPVPGRQGLLPPPRSSLETQWTGAYHLHLGDLPDASGFFQVRNARGQISLPSEELIINRDTTDYSFNFGLNPTLHLGTNVLNFSAGIQETVRRDSLSPVEMNQNLFRQFLYMSTSSFFNMVSVTGYAIREAGPFTESSQRSRDLAAALNFRVGRPWGKTALLTGWGARDDQFSPVISEDYYTSAYLGIERRVSERINFTVVAEDLRAWRVQGGNSARLRRPSAQQAAFTSPRRVTGAFRRRSHTHGIWAFTSTTRCRAASPSLMQCPSTARLRTQAGRSNSSIRFVFRRGWNRRLSLISRVGRINSSGLICASVCSEIGIR